MDGTIYHAYLLRTWRADNDGRPTWRFTLQPTDGGPTLIFGTPGALLAFLENQPEGKQVGNPRSPPSSNRND